MPDASTACCALTAAGVLVLCLWRRRAKRYPSADRMHEIARCQRASRWLEQQENARKRTAL